MIPSRVTRVRVDTQIPWMLMQSTLSRLSVENIFNEIAMQAKAQASNCMPKANSASHGPRVSPHSQAKARVKTTRENNGKSIGTKSANQGARGLHKGRTSKAGLSGLENSKSEASSDTQESAQTCTTDISWNDGWICDEWNAGWSFDEWNDDWGFVGWHEGWEQVYDTSRNLMFTWRLDFSATSSPKRFEWVKMDLDTGAAANTFLLNFGPDGTGDGRFYRTVVSGFRMVELGNFKDTVQTDCSDL